MVRVRLGVFEGSAVLAVPKDGIQERCCVVLRAALQALLRKYCIKMCVFFLEGLPGFGSLLLAGAYYTRAYDCCCTVVPLPL